jgi:hypothetical protein
MAVTWKKVAYEDAVITKAVLTEQGDIVYASGAATPAALPHGTSGDVLTSGGHGANPSWQAPGAPAAHTLNSHSAADGAVDFNNQVATDLVFMNAANVAALPTTNIAVGQPCFATAELTLHICTAIE